MDCRIEKHEKSEGQYISKKKYEDSRWGRAIKYVTKKKECERKN